MFGKICFIYGGENKKGFGRAVSKKFFIWLQQRNTVFSKEEITRTVSI